MSIVRTEYSTDLETGTPLAALVSNIADNIQYLFCKISNIHLDPENCKPGLIAGYTADDSAEIEGSETEAVDDLLIEEFKTEPEVEDGIVIKEEICYFESVEDPLDDDDSINQVTFSTSTEYKR